MGKIDVGNKATGYKSGPPRLIPTVGAPERQIEAPNSSRMTRPENCGAMSQQCGDSGNHSTPQKFVQLVGYRNPKARSEKARSEKVSSEKASSEPRVRPGLVKP